MLGIHGLSYLSRIFSSMIVLLHARKNTYETCLWFNFPQKYYYMKHEDVVFVVWNAFVTSINVDVF